MVSMPSLRALDNMLNPWPGRQFFKMENEIVSDGIAQAQMLQIWINRVAMPLSGRGDSRSAESGGKGEVPGNISFCFSRDLKNIVSPVAQ